MIWGFVSRVQRSLHATLNVGYLKVNGTDLRPECTDRYRFDRAGFINERLIVIEGEFSQVSEC